MTHSADSDPTESKDHTDGTGEQLSPADTARSADEHGGTQQTPRRRRLMPAILLAAGVAFGVWWLTSVSASTYLQRARKAAAHGEWEPTIQHLTSYLQQRPGDWDAHMLIAEAFIKANRSDLIQATEQAVSHLQQIPDDAALAARARLQQGRLTLFMLKQPGAAEQLLKEALRLDPGSAEAGLLLWQLLDVTGRHVLAPDVFWQVYELIPKPQRGLLLRDWYLAEFHPEQLYAELYRRMNVADVGKFPASINLLVHFREVEPDAVFLHAALAKYYHELGNLNSTMELLKECPNIQTAMQDPFFVSVLFEALIDGGEFQKADDCFDRFPEPHSGYLYWRSESMYHDYVNSDCDAAIESFRKALATDQARFDWGLMERYSVCLRKTGATEEAERWHDRVTALTTSILTTERTSDLQQALRQLNHPDVAEQLIEFYSEFGLKREVAAWNDYKNYLNKQQRTPASR